MNPTLASKSAVNPKAQNRRTAVCVAAYVWVVGIVIGLTFAGKSFQPANSNAAAAAIAGLAAWTVWHMVTRRNDGYYLVMSGLPSVIQPARDIGFLPLLGILLVSLVPIAWLGGHFRRRFDSKAECGVPRSTDAMYDAEIDQSAMDYGKGIPNE